MNLVKNIYYKINLRIKNIFWYLLILIFPFFIIGCQPQVSLAQTILPNYGLLTSNNVGQTFLSTNAGLNSISILIHLENPSSTKLNAYLYESPKASQAIRQASIAITQNSSDGWYSFAFPPVNNSLNKHFYFQISNEGPSVVDIGIKEYSSYLEGGMYENKIPNGYQIDFNTSYYLIDRIIGIGSQLVNWAFETLPSLIILLLPGWGLLILFWSLTKNLSLGDNIGISAALSASIFPIVFEILYFLGIHSGQMVVWVLFGTSLIILFINRKRIYENIISYLKQKPCKLLPDIILLFILLLIWLSRFWAVRNSSVPTGLDPIHHTAIVDLILYNGGLFQSWQPIASYSSFSTHFGFHVLAAAYTWVTGIESTKSIIIMGQVINVLSVASLYPLAKYLANGNRWAGVGAVLAGGLLSPMPAYMMNWGRFPQITGQLILPVICLITMTTLTKVKEMPKYIILMGICGAGLFLAYYRMPIIFACFVFSYLLYWTLLNIRQGSGYIFRTYLLIGLSGVFAVLLGLPWIIHLMNSPLNTSDIQGAITTIDQVKADYTAWNNVLFYTTIPLLVGAFIGFMLGINRKNWILFTLILWVGFQSTIVATALIGLPGAELMQNNAILMTLYIPLSILFGQLTLYIEILVNKKTILKVTIISILLFTGIYGAQTLARVANPYDHTFITGPDIKAIAWIRKNTPLSARFFVLSQRFKGTSAIGMDGGWWISVLTHRQTNIPPQYALIMERPIDPFYNTQVIDWAFDLERFNIYEPQGIKLLCENNFNYLYIGQYGRYVAPGAKDRYIDTRVHIKGNKALDPVYLEDQVAIYKVRQDECKTYENIP